MDSRKRRLESLGAQINSRLVRVMNESRQMIAKYLDGCSESGIDME